MAWKGHCGEPASASAWISRVSLEIDNRDSAHKLHWHLHSEGGSAISIRRWLIALLQARVEGHVVETMTHTSTSTNEHETINGPRSFPNWVIAVSLAAESTPRYSALAPLQWTDAAFAGDDQCFGAVGAGMMWETYLLSALFKSPRTTSTGPKWPDLTKDALAFPVYVYDKSHDAAFCHSDAQDSSFSRKQRWIQRFHQGVLSCTI